MIKMKVRVYLLFVFPIKMTDSGPLRSVVPWPPPSPQQQNCSGTHWGRADWTCPAPALTDLGVLFETVGGVYVIK